MIRLENVVLDNKVRLILCSDETKNQTYAEIIVNFGGKNEKFKVGDREYFIPNGTAHLLEHTLIEDSLYGNLFDYYKDKYVYFNGSTSFNETSYYIEIVENFYERLEELIKIVNTPVFTQENQEKIKPPIFQEIRQSEDGLNKSFEEKYKECTLYSTKNRNVLGTTQDLDNLDVDILKFIHKIFYQPKNQTLFITGNFNIEKVKEIITKTYSELKREEVLYEILDEKEPINVIKKHATVYDDEQDALVNINFKIDLSKFTPKEKCILTFYISHFLHYNFSDSSKAFKTLYENKDTIYSIAYNTDYSNKDMLIMRLIMIGTNEKRFKEIVFDIVNKKCADEDKFNIAKKSDLMNIIKRSNRAHSLGYTCLENTIYFDYYEPEKISDVEAFSFEEYQEFLSRLDFSNYNIIIRKHKTKKI